MSRYSYAQPIAIPSISQPRGSGRYIYSPTQGMVRLGDAWTPPTTLWWTVLGIGLVASAGYLVFKAA